MFRSTGQARERICPKNAKNVFGDLSRMAEFVAYRGSEKAVDVGLVESVTMNLNAAIDMGMKNVAQQRIVRDMQNLGSSKAGSCKHARQRTATLSRSRSTATRLSLRLMTT